MKDENYQVSIKPIRLTPGQVRKPELRQITELLYKGFHDYPAIKYIFPDPEERARKFNALLEFDVRYCLRVGELYVTSMNFEGMVMWLPPPPSYFASILSVLRAGLISSFFKVGFKAQSRLSAISKDLQKYRRQEAPFPHWYGGWLCVHPDHRGKGYAKILLKTKLDELYRKGIPVYGYTQKQENVKIYEKYGYEVMGERYLKGIDDEVTNVYSWSLLLRPKNH